MSRRSTIGRIASRSTSVTSPGLPASSARAAAPRASAIGTVRTSHLSSGSAGGATESVVKPRPSRSTAESGSDAISPHTLTAIPRAVPAARTSRSRRRIAGSCGVKREAMCALPRSTARVYWVRSLVPTLKKELTLASRSATTTAAGVSIITPTGSSFAARIPAAARAAASSASSSRARSTSAARGTENGVRLLGRAEGRGELVSAQVEGAHDHGLAAEGRPHPAEVGALLVFTGKVRPAGHQELGAEEPDALGPVAHGDVDFVGQVHIAHERDRFAVRRDRRLPGHGFELELELVPPRGDGLGRFELFHRRIEQDRPAGAVEQHQGTRGNPADRAGDPHDAGNAEGVRQDRGVRGPGAFLAHHPLQLLAVELDREPGIDLVGDDHHLGMVAQSEQLVVALSGQVAQDPDLGGEQVDEALPEARAPCPAPLRAELEGLELVGGFGAQVILPDQVLDPRQEDGVARHHGLRLEDASLLEAGALQHPEPEPVQAAPHVLDRLVQPADFPFHFDGRHRAIGHLRKPPLQHHRGGECEAGRDADAVEDPLGARHSPNPDAMSALSAATAAASSAPCARTMMELPFSAASIMTPMMLLPFTGMPSFTSSISLLKVLASLTSWAAGRACSPSGLTTMVSRSITERSSARAASRPRRPS